MRPEQRRLAEGALFTDQYQFTMAQLYFRMGMHESRVLFEHFFRDYPDYGDHRAGYCINAGLGWLLDWMGQAKFGAPELEALAGQRSAGGNRLFAKDFLSWLGESGNLAGVSLRAIPEGRVVHAGVPLTVVEWPLAVAQILETPVLNHLNFQTLVATKASRIAEATRGRPVLEFGMRRAAGEGANAATRAALIGGADYSSNVGISHALGFPPKGTHAHSMVQAFLAIGQSELEAFRAYAEVYPDDCLLLVDTVDTLESGLPNAIEVFQELRRKGHRPLGVRLDSGDLAHLAVQAARLLDAAGFSETSIVLSSRLDELTIFQILRQIADEAPRYGVDADQLIRRLTYGVGARMATSHGDPALDGVYKLVAVERGGEWHPALKVSDSPEKVLNPGAKAVWRVYDQRGLATADLQTLATEDPRVWSPIVLHHPTDPGVRRVLTSISSIEPLLEDILIDGRHVWDPQGIEEARARRRADLDRLDPGVRRLVNPHIYHVSLSTSLSELKRQLVEDLAATP